MSKFISNRRIVNPIKCNKSNGNRTYKNGKPQEDLVLDYLKDNGSMDEFDAKEFNINRNSLTRTVNDLKKRGVDIKSDHYDRGVSTFSHKPKTVRNYVLEST